MKTFSASFPLLTRLAAGAAGLGFVAGLRSQIPLLLLAVAANEDRFAVNVNSGTPLGVLNSQPALFGAVLSTAGELVFDKLPFVPDRISPLPLAGRLFFGGLAGAAVFRNQSKPMAAGAVMGAAGAVAGSYAGYYSRVTLGRKTEIPGQAWGVVEDVIAFGLGILALRAVTSEVSAFDDN